MRSLKLPSSWLQITVLCALLFLGSWLIFSKQDIIIDDACAQSDGACSNTKSNIARQNSGGLPSAGVDDDDNSSGTVINNLASMPRVRKMTAKCEWLLNGNTTAMAEARKTDGVVDRSGSNAA